MVLASVYLVYFNINKKEIKDLVNQYYESIPIGTENTAVISTFGQPANIIEPSDSTNLPKDTYIYQYYPNNMFIEVDIFFKKDNNKVFQITHSVGGSTPGAKPIK